MLVLTAIMAISASSLLAQKSLRERMANDFCVELNKMDIPEEFSESTMEKIGLAILPITGKYAAEIKKEFGLDMNSQEDYHKIGEIIGEEAGKSCEKFRLLLENMINNTMESAEDFQNLDGTFVGLDATGAFAFVRIKDASGREQKLWWMEYFPGSEELVSASAKLKGKSVSVSYTEREVYEPKVKDYVHVKVLAGLTQQ